MKKIFFMLCPFIHNLYTMEQHTRSSIFHHSQQPLGPFFSKLPLEIDRHIASYLPQLSSINSLENKIVKNDKKQIGILSSNDSKLFVCDSSFSKESYAEPSFLLAGRPRPKDSPKKIGLKYFDPNLNEYAFEKIWQAPKNTILLKLAVSPLHSKFAIFGYKKDLTGTIKEIIYIINRLTKNKKKLLLKVKLHA